MFDTFLELVEFDPVTVKTIWKYASGKIAPQRYLQVTLAIYKLHSTETALETTPHHSPLTP